MKTCLLPTIITRNFTKKNSAKKESKLEINKILLFFSQSIKAQKVVVFLLLFFSLTIFSQNKISKKDKEAYSNLLKEVRLSNEEEAIIITDSTYNVAVKKGNKILEILILNVKIDNSVNKGDINTFNNLFSRQYAKISNLETSFFKDSLLIEHLNKQGHVLGLFGNITEAINKITESLILAKKNKTFLNDTIFLKNKMGSYF